MATKVCTRCGEEKDMEMFTVRKDRPCGRVAMCKPCCSKYTMERRDKAEHAKKRKEHRDRRPDLMIAAQRRYVESHPEYRLKQARRIREFVNNNPGWAQEAKKNWLAKNEGIQRYYTHNYRAKKRKNGGELTPNLEGLLMSEQGCRCPYCEADLRKTRYELDHYIPVDLGGPNEDWNIQLTCPTCNKRKSNKHPLAFIGFEAPDEDVGKDI